MEYKDEDVTCTNCGKRTVLIYKTVCWECWNKTTTFQHLIFRRRAKKREKENVETVSKGTKTI
jgi:hypothetical protein